MAARVFVVTGATSGIGEAIALGIAGQSNQNEVMIVGRNESKCQAARDRIIAQSSNSKISYEVVDLSLYSSIKKFAAGYRASGRQLHVLVNNAATCPIEKNITSEGIEMQWATNQMAYYWLSTEFLDDLKRSAPSRVLMVGSDYAGHLRLDDVNFYKRPYDNNTAYMAAKQANRMLSAHLGKLLHKHEIVVNAFHPGSIRSKLAEDLGFHLSGTPEQGAAVGVQLATSSSFADVTARWFMPTGREEVDGVAQDSKKNEELFNFCEQLTATIQKSGHI